MENKHLIILVIIALICVGIFIYQFNNNVGTLITLNQSEVTENNTFAGMLTDAYGWGIANQTITYQTANTTKTTQTNDEGKFIIKAEYIPGAENYYTNFTYSGNGKYQPCEYQEKVTVTQ